MSKNKRNDKERAISVFLLSVIFLGMCSTIVSATAYQTTLSKGTELFQVITYDEDEWQATVDASSSPSAWIDGDANITGAQSKITTRGWVTATWSTYDVLQSLFLADLDPMSLYLVNTELSSKGYNESDINENYNNTYAITLSLRTEWIFTSSAFNESAANAMDVLAIPSNPADYKKVLDDYNDLAFEIQNDGALFTIHSFFPNITADEFLWNLAMSTLAMGTPISPYIQDLVDILNCENASYSGNTLIIERTGEKNYTVEITYGAQGTMTSFVVKNEDGTVLYQFVSIGNTNWIVYTIVGVIIACFSGLMVYIIYRKKKFNKLKR